ncbi:MAG: hypothetical protein CML80_07430 [Rhodobiaceae bacterium]|jgi:hypothetical protein|nr:hypothetical protein [Rhodobiaceae bacterium]
MFNRSRIWLFAPFIGLFFLGVGFFSLWSYAGDEVEARLEAENITWQSLARSGFPARLTMDFVAMGWRTQNLAWSVPALRFTVMPFETDHAVVDFSSPHRITTAFGKMRIDHSGNLASLVLDTQGLARASFSFTKPQVQIMTTKENIALAGDDVKLHIRRAPDNAARTDIALRTGRITGDARLGISRSEIDINTPQSWLTDAPAAGDLVGIDNFIITRDALTFRGSGRMKLAASGFVDGKLDMDVVNLVALFELLEDAGLTRKRDRQKLMLLAQLSSAFSGKSRDRLQVPLRFREARSFIGSLEVGPAPRWR